jgi:hypothetical protein
MATDEIQQTIVHLLNGAGPGRTVSPTDVARVLKPGPEWHVLMPAVRRAAVGLALAGQLVITRKGKPVDPSDFKGVYRLGLPRHD